jgi:hypothetical protein
VFRRLRHVALFVERLAGVVVRVRKIRLQLGRAFELLRGEFEVVRARRGEPELVVDVGVVAGRLGGAPTRLHCLAIVVLQHRDAGRPELLPGIVGSLVAQAVHLAGRCVGVARFQVSQGSQVAIFG